MKINKRFLLKAGAAVALVVLLATTAYAFSLIMYKVKDNYFQTGHVDVAIAFAPEVEGKVDLQDDIKYEPGMRVRGDFTVYNLSVGDDKAAEDGIWYRIYFTDVTRGKLAEVMEATIYDGEKVLCSSTVAKWKNNRTLMEAQALGHGESKTLTLELHFPEEAGNDYQGIRDGKLEYQLAVVATQRRNNPNQEFGNG